VEVACVEDKEKIVVFYVGDIETEEMVEFLQSLTGQKKTIFYCRKIAEIPRTSSGKISYKDLQEVT
jgi:acyl-coenzyme A synthetase/AMP-(fatty) acid ligase